MILRERRLGNDVSGETAGPRWTPGAGQLCFLHIGKTGGTSIHWLIRNTFPTAPTFHGDAAAFDEASRSDLDKCDIILGHFSFGHTYKFGRNPALITVVRDPVDRLISAYHYMRQLPPSDDVDVVRDMAQRYSFGEFLRCDLPEIRMFTADHQCYALTTDWRAPRDAEPHRVASAAFENLHRFRFVGVSEYLDAGISQLAALLGREVPPAGYHLNKTRKRPRRDDIEPSLIDLIERLNQADCELYNRVHHEISQSGRHSMASRSAKMTKIQLPSSYQRPSPSENDASVGYGFTSAARGKSIGAANAMIAAWCVDEAVRSVDENPISLVLGEHEPDRFVGCLWGPIEIAEGDTRPYRVLCELGVAVILHRTTERSGFTIKLIGAVVGERNTGDLTVTINDRPPLERHDQRNGRDFTIEFGVSQEAVEAARGRLVIRLSDPGHDPGYPANCLGFMSYHIRPQHSIIPALQAEIAELQRRAAEREAAAAAQQALLEAAQAEVGSLGDKLAEANRGGAERLTAAAMEVGSLRAGARRS